MVTSVELRLQRGVFRGRDLQVRDQSRFVAILGLLQRLGGGLTAAASLRLSCSRLVQRGQVVLDFLIRGQHRVAIVGDLLIVRGVRLRGLCADAGRRRKR